MNARLSRLIFTVGMALIAMLLVTITPAQTRAIHLPNPPQSVSTNAVTTTQHWQDELVDGLGLVGTGSSIALDENGYPHIAYYDEMYHTLRYAAWDGVAWQIDIVDSNVGVPITPLLVGMQTSLAVYHGMAYIAYDKSIGTDTRYIGYASGGIGSWTISALSPVKPELAYYGPSLAIDASHNLHAVYTSVISPGLLAGFPQQIVYARLDPVTAAWVTQTVSEMPSDTHDPEVDTTLAVGRNNQPHIAYVGLRPFPEFEGDLIYAHLNGGTWQTNTVDTGTAFPSIAIDFAGNPHLTYDKLASLTYAFWDGSMWQTQEVTNTFGRSSLALDALDRPRIVSGNVYFQWTGTVWQSEIIATDRYDAPALALDRLGNPHISYWESFYSDLHHVFWASDWQTQTIALAGGGPHLAIDLHNRPYISYHEPNHYNVSLASWTAFGDWRYQAVMSAAPYHSLRLLYGANHEALPILSYFNYDAAVPSFYDLGFAEWNGTMFLTQTIEAAKAPGNWLSMAVNPGGNPVIGYYDGQHVKYAVGNLGNWTIHADTGGPPVHNPWLSIGSSSQGNTYIAYGDDLSPTLRLATFDGTQWTDELIDSANHYPVGINVSLAVDGTTGKPAMAYFDAAQRALKYAYWRGAWLTEVVDASLPDVSDLSLSLAAGSDQYPRITYVTPADNSLRLAWSTVPTQTWTIETVGTFPNVNGMEVSSQVQTRDHIVYSQPSTGVVYAFRSSTLEDSIDYNPLRPCPEITFTLRSVGPALNQLKAMKPTDLSQVDDLTTLRALRDMLALSPMARHYIDMYYQYAPETGALALADPSLMWDSYRTLQNFLPGLASLAAGNGDAVVITQSMVDEVNNILDRLVAAGSPSLQTTITQERAKYNHLQVFVGQTFTQAATLVGINLTPSKVYLPEVRK